MKHLGKIKHTISDTIQPLSVSLSGVNIDDWNINIVFAF